MLRVIRIQTQLISVCVDWVIGLKTTSIRAKFLGILILSFALQWGCRLSPTGGHIDENTKQLLWTRRYKQGEKIGYRMTATNRDRFCTQVYEINANGLVKLTQGKYYEEFTWTNLISAVETNEIDLFSLPTPSILSDLLAKNKKVSQAPLNANFHQQLSLAPGFELKIPDFSNVNPMLVGPVSDLLTFYSDLLVASNFPKNAKAGDHIHFAYGKPASWADGIHVVTGEDSIDFECSIQDIDLTNQTVTFLVRHIPPAKPQVKLTAEWMRPPVADTPNNWVQVTKTRSGHYQAEVGKETFDDEIKINLMNGRIISAKMDNSVEVLQRECTDVTLAECGRPVHFFIRRQVKLY